MKKTFLMVIIATTTLLTFNSCQTTSGGHGKNASMISKTLLNSYNEYDLNISDTPIEYVIDITTAEGAAKLNKLSLSQAEDLALREAIMKYKCALLFNPQYTHVKKGKQILRVRVYGFPAVYKNQK